MSLSFSDWEREFNDLREWIENDIESLFVVVKYPRPVKIQDGWLSDVFIGFRFDKITKTEKGVEHSFFTERFEDLDLIFNTEEEAVMKLSMMDPDFPVFGLSPDSKLTNIWFSSFHVLSPYEISMNLRLLYSNNVHR